MECMLNADAEIGIDTSVVVPIKAKEINDEPGYNPNYQQPYNAPNNRQIGRGGNYPHAPPEEFGTQVQDQGYYVYYPNNPNSNRNNRGGNNPGGADPNAMDAELQQQFNMDEEDDEPFAPNFGTQSIRSGFIKKVYLILTFQLTLFALIVALFIFMPSVRESARNYFPAYYMTGFAVFLLTYCTLICNSKLRRKVPINFILLIIMSLGFAVQAATVSVRYDTYIVLMSLGVTAVVCLVVTGAAWINIFDMTKFRSYLFVAAVLIMVLVLIHFIMSFFIRIQILTVVINVLLTFLFVGFLMYDTQMIIGGKKHKHELSAEEYILGAILLYVDMVYLFMLILSLIGVCHGNRS